MPRNNHGPSSTSRQGGSTSVATPNTAGAEITELEIVTVYYPMETSLTLSIGAWCSDTLAKAIPVERIDGLCRKWKGQLIVLHPKHKDAHGGIRLKQVVEQPKPGEMRALARKLRDDLQTIVNEVAPPFRVLVSITQLRTNRECEKMLA